MHEQQPEPPENEPAGPRPRIYVASLSDYNAGRLHGRWIDAARDPAELHADIDAMLRVAPARDAEEWAIHDHEGFGDWRLSEYESIETVSAVAAGIVEHGPAVAAWASHVDGDLDELARFEDAYRGVWNSVEAYAEDLLDDLGAAGTLAAAVPDWIEPYVHLDVDGFARDLELSGDIWVSVVEGGVAIFDGTV